MGRPPGRLPPNSVADQPATGKHGPKRVHAECRLRFAFWFSTPWSADLAEQILGDDAHTIHAALRRVARQHDRHALLTLDWLHAAALAAVEESQLDAPATIMRETLRRIVAALPPELVTESASWKPPSEPALRARVLANAPRALHRAHLTERELAVVGILAGVPYRAHDRDKVKDVLRREANAYSTAKRRQKR